jgi:hypothetical protein
MFSFAALNAIIFKLEHLVEEADQPKRLVSICPPTGTTALTAYVSELTTLKYLELRGGLLTAAAAMMHLQHLTRLTTLYLSNITGDDDDEYNGFHFWESVARVQVCVGKVRLKLLKGACYCRAFACCQYIFCEHESLGSAVLFGGPTRQKVNLQTKTMHMPV